MEKSWPQIKEQGTQNKNIEIAQSEKILAEIHADKEKLKLPENVSELDTRLLRIQEGREWVERQIKNLRDLRGKEKGARLTKKFMVDQDQKTFDDLVAISTLRKNEEDRTASELLGLLEEDPDLMKKYAKFYTERKEKLALLNPKDIQAN